MKKAGNEYKRQKTLWIKKIQCFSHYLVCVCMCVCLCVYVCLCVLLCVCVYASMVVDMYRGEEKRKNENII